MTALNKRPDRSLSSFSSTRAVFLDRDGTLIEEANYLRHPDQVRLLPGVPDALRSLVDAGFGLILITNQSGIARGLFTEQDLTEIHAELETQLEKECVQLDGIYYCPFHPEGKVARYRMNSRLRKPQPGMIEDALRDFPSLDPSECWAVGDSPRDIQSTHPWTSMQTILVRTGHGAHLSPREISDCSSDFVAQDFSEAASIILRESSE